MSLGGTTGADRALDLLADRATDGLSASQQAELDQLLLEHPEFDDESMDLAAARAAVAMAGAEPLPTAIARRAAARGEAWVLAHAPTRRVHPDARAHNGAVRAAPRRRARVRYGPYAGWIAAAACLALAVVLWSGRNALPGSGVQGAGLTAADGLAALRRAGDRILTGDWTWRQGFDSTGKACRGQVVWCPARQEGYMVFRGLAPNDPSREQYQLWIFDDARDERYPVHGGVFDVPPGRDEVIVRIEPRLPVSAVSRFVVTVEKPGGVWVSDRSRIPVLAQLTPP